MVYTKKEWVNVPDPDNYTGNTPLSDLPRFDAENMNRIESGIVEVFDLIENHTPKNTEEGTYSRSHISDEERVEFQNGCIAINYHLDNREYKLLKTIEFNRTIETTAKASSTTRYPTKLTGVNFGDYDDILIVVNGSIEASKNNGLNSYTNTAYAYIASLNNGDGAIFASIEQSQGTGQYKYSINNCQLELKKSNYSKIVVSASESGDTIATTQIERCAMNHSSVARFTNDIYVGLGICNANTSNYKVTADLTLSIYGKKAI